MTMQRSVFDDALRVGTRDNTWPHISGASPTKTPSWSSAGILRNVVGKIDGVFRVFGFWLLGRTCTGEKGR
jgi:hypothetical protein